MRKPLLVASALLLLLQRSTQHADTNELVGDAVVDCGENAISIRFETLEPFSGIAFVRNHLEQPECRSPPPDEHWHRNTSLRLKFSDCNLERRVSEEPPGMFVTANIVVAFHPQFLTKHDRVFIVECYYMAMERRLTKTVNITMPGPRMQTAVVKMPVCRYEVLEGSPTGPPVLFAKVGQMVYHKWTCESTTTDTFCMRVHSCTVDDGDGNRVELIDQEGCAHDRYLLQNLEYISDLMVGKEAHVYKYADKDGVYFQCQIAITVKEPGQEYCQVPECPDPPRRRRSFMENDEKTLYEIVLPNRPAIDFILDHPPNNVSAAASYTPEPVRWKLKEGREEACLSDEGAACILLLNAALLAAALLFSGRSLCLIIKQT